MILRCSYPLKMFSSIPLLPTSHGEPWAWNRLGSMWSIFNSCGQWLQVYFPVGPVLQIVFSSSIVLLKRITYFFFGTVCLFQLTGGPPPSSMPASPRAITLPLLLQAERAWPNDQPVQVGSAATSFEDVLTSTKDQLHFAIEWAKMLPPFFDLALEDQVHFFIIKQCNFTPPPLLRLF